MSICLFDDVKCPPDFSIVKTLCEEANFNKWLCRPKLFSHLNNVFNIYTSASFPKSINPHPMTNDGNVIKRSGESELVGVVFILNLKISLEVPYSNLIF